MGNTIICKVGEESILLDIDSEIQEDEERNYELWRAETYATKEPDTIEWINSFFQKGDIIYDIGANIGQYALYAAKRLKGNCKIFAFEPEALNYAKLNKNIVKCRQRFVQNPDSNRYDSSFGNMLSIARFI